MAHPPPHQATWHATVTCFDTLLEGDWGHAPLRQIRVGPATPQKEGVVPWSSAPEVAEGPNPSFYGTLLFLLPSESLLICTGELRGTLSERPDPSFYRARLSLLPGKSLLELGTSGSGQNASSTAQEACIKQQGQGYLERRIRPLSLVPVVDSRTDPTQPGRLGARQQGQRHSTEERTGPLSCC